MNTYRVTLRHIVSKTYDVKAPDAKSATMMLKRTIIDAQLIKEDYEMHIGSPEMAPGLCLVCGKVTRQLLWNGEFCDHKCKYTYDHRKK